MSSSQRGAIRRKPARRCALLVGLIATTSSLTAFAQVFDAGRARFSVSINGDFHIPYRTFTIFVVPGEDVSIATAPDVSIEADAGVLAVDAAGRWHWRAPASPGIATLEFARAQHLIHLNALVMHPAEQAASGSLHGYRIGQYPEPLNDEAAYAAPDGFFELASSDDDVQLSPHFRLSQFPSKQSQGYPKFLTLREDLLLKLEMLLERVNELGIAAPTFTVMSGFRTPMYNHAIDNVSHSQHIFGGAADIYIDESPRDGIMDDLNGDGVLDFRDAQYLFAIAEELFSREAYENLQGGLGVYRSTAAHGPFIHIDARGRRARWGLIPSPGRN